MMFLGALIGTSSKYLNSKPLTIFFATILITQFFFIKRMMEYFTRAVLVRLCEDDISFSIRNLKDDGEEHFKQYPLHDISSYKIQFPTSRFLSLIIKLNSGRSQEFTFQKQNLSPAQSDTDNLIETIHQYFVKHNVDFAPSFFASKKGLYVIISFVFLLCIPIAIAINLDKNLPATIFATIVILLQLILRRVSDLNFYKKWKKA